MPSKISSGLSCNLLLNFSEITDFNILHTTISEQLKSLMQKLKAVYKPVSSYLEKFGKVTSKVMYLFKCYNQRNMTNRERNCTYLP